MIALYFRLKMFGKQLKEGESIVNTLNLKEYLEVRGLLRENSSGFEVTAGQVVEFIRELGAMSDVNLSGANIIGRLVLRDLLLEDFNGEECNFEDGVEIIHCEFFGSLSFDGAYVLKNWRLENVTVSKDLFHPENFFDLTQTKGYEVIRLNVMGRTLFRRV